MSKAEYMTVSIGLYGPVTLVRSEGDGWGLGMAQYSSEYGSQPLPAAAPGVQSEQTPGTAAASQAAAAGDPAVVAARDAVARAFDGQQ